MFMSKAPMIRWIERSPYLHEARVTTAEGMDLYAGYVAVTPGTDVWRGYVGRGFVPLGTGPLTMMQAAVERRGAEIVEHADTQERPIYRDTSSPLNSTMAAETDTHGVI